MIKLSFILVTLLLISTNIKATENGEIVIKGFLKNTNNCHFIVQENKLVCDNDTMYKTKSKKIKYQNAQRQNKDLNTTQIYIY